MTVVREENMAVDKVDPGYDSFSKLFLFLDLKVNLIVRNFLLN